MPIEITTLAFETTLDLANDYLILNDTSEGALNKVTPLALLGQNLVDIRALAAPGADRLLFWDHSATKFEHLTLGTNLSITGTTINASGGGGSGDVVGPASATDNAVARFDSTTGKLIQNSGVIINDNGGIQLNPSSGTYAIDVDRTTNTGTQFGIRIVSGDNSNLAASKALFIANAAEDRGITFGYESSSSFAVAVDSSSLRMLTSGGVGGREIRLQPGDKDRFITPVRKDLSNNTTTGIFEVALPTLTGTGGVIKCTTFVSNGTDIQSRSQIIRYSAVNKGGTYTTEIVVVSEAASLSTGTLTGTWSILNGTDKITLRFNSNSSLTPTTQWVHYTIESFSDQAITLL